MKHSDILSKLSLSEKIRWTSGNSMWTMLGNEQLNIREITVADGPHGVRVYKKVEEGHSLTERNLAESTMFPSAAAMASTFNEKLVYEIGQTIGAECNMFGVDVLLAPGVNLKRSPLGGRNFEYYSEDPFLTGRMAINFINGVQSTGVGACVKHYALNEQETQRRFVNSIVDQRTLFEYYLRPFEMVIKEAKPYTIMSSYNQVNGDYAGESLFLLQEVLRDRWNYDGTVISDWGGVQHKVKSIKNGMNIEMPGPSEFMEEVVSAVANNDLTEAEIDKSLRPLLVLYDRVMANPNQGQKTSLEQNHQIAKHVAEEAIVLLENDGILPLTKGLSIGVIGEFAEKPRINGGGSATLKSYILENPLQELQLTFDVDYAPGYHEEHTTEHDLTEVANICKNNDLILFFTGTTASLETEGKDREHMNIPSGHLEVFEEIIKHNKTLIVILNNGSAVNVTPFIPHVNAMIEAWFLGSANAKALVEVLTGTVNPSGRLSETFPINIESTPHYKDFPSLQDEVYYHNDILTTSYRYYDTHQIPVLYPFGYGLSYANFSYSNLRVNHDVMTDGDILEVLVDITNRSDVDGYEVIQLYVGDPESYYPRPSKELKGFQKHFIHAGETKTIMFELEEDAFAIYSVDFQDFRVESGQYDILIGKNSRDIELICSIQYETKKPLRQNLTIDHPLKNFFLYKNDNVKYLEEKYHKFPWWEIEEPAIRVLKRLQRKYQISQIAFEEMITKLLQ